MEITLDDIVDEDILESAYAWLCKRRRNYPDHADVWNFRRHWRREIARLSRELLEGSYRLGLLSRTTLESGEEVDLFSARDALVLKALSLVLASQLSFSRNCTHLKGNRGGKGAVRRVWRHLKRHQFVLRTDVRSYYASIDHQCLMERLSRIIQDRRVLNLIEQYLRRTAEQGGLFWESERGIPLGSPLSPMIGAFFLTELDQRLERTGLFYVRFMDDILVLAPTRWRLRRAVRVLNQVLSSLKLEKHPEKTFIGRIEKGFDFLGYHFSQAGLTVARTTLENFAARALRLHEQESGEPLDSSRLGEYVRRWSGWVRGGLPEGAISFGFSLGVAVRFLLFGGRIVVLDGEIHELDGQAVSASDRTVSLT